MDSAHPLSKRALIVSFNFANFWVSVLVEYSAASNHIESDKANGTVRKYISAYVHFRARPAARPRATSGFESSAAPRAEEMHPQLSPAGRTVRTRLRPCHRLLTPLASPYPLLSFCQAFLCHRQHLVGLSLVKPR
ncbi:hypothetical protein K474DRAFT_1667701 [Panus rudis PR-1116 ss-1]|nr:hypothetical protein K474DRAFT_1667701 [Panus rudis PR-1116 ss-1]